MAARTTFVPKGDLTRLPTSHGSWPITAFPPSSSDSDEDEDVDAPTTSTHSRSQLHVHESPLPWSSPPHPLSLVSRADIMNRVSVPVADLTCLAVFALRHAGADTMVDDPPVGGLAAPILSLEYVMEHWQEVGPVERQSQWWACVERVFPRATAKATRGHRPEPLDVAVLATSMDAPVVVDENDDGNLAMMTRFTIVGNTPSMEWDVTMVRPLTRLAARPAPSYFSMPDLAIAPAPPIKEVKRPREVDKPAATPSRPAKRPKVELVPATIRCPDRVTRLAATVPGSPVAHLVRAPMLYALADVTERFFENNLVVEMLGIGPLAGNACAFGSQVQLSNKERIQFYTLLRAMVQQGAGKVDVKVVAAQYFGGADASEYPSRVTHFCAALTFLQLFVVPGVLTTTTLLNFSPWLAFSLVDATADALLRQWGERHAQDPAYFPHLAQPAPTSSRTTAKAPKKHSYTDLLAPPARPAPDAMVGVVEEVVVAASSVLDVTHAVPLAMLPALGDHALFTGAVNVAAMTGLLMQLPGEDDVAEFRLAHGAALYDFSRAPSKTDLATVGRDYLTWCMKQQGGAGYAELPCLFWFYVMELFVACFVDPARDPFTSDFSRAPFVARE